VSLNHHLDLPWMREAFRRTRKDGAVGIDGETAQDYAENLDGNLSELLDQVKSGTYKAPPVRRGWVPKPDKEEHRPIGVPTFERKVLESALVQLLEPLYEQDFLDCSFGFRPERSQQDALESIFQAIQGGCHWVIDADIRKYFDTMMHRHLRAFLDRRVRDGVVRRTLDKMLKAGVWEKGRISYSDTGAPQGGVISPLLSNIYLHEVLDSWFVELARPQLEGRAYLIRFADDFLICCQYKRDAERLMGVLPKRFGKYGLEIHPEKTRLLDFRPPDDRPDGDKPSTFDFLGFTHYWGRSRRGRPLVKKRTAQDRQRRALRTFTEFCRDARHWSIAEQHKVLCQKLIGHYCYYGTTGNTVQPKRLHNEVVRTWRKWLDRRDRKRSLRWEVFKERILQHFPLPRPRIVNTIQRLQKRPMAGVLC
jgi:group II intron reverse transcriptase/maturase